MKITNDQFVSLLEQIIDNDNAKPSQLLTIPGIYDVLSEHYNNDVLEQWGEDQDD